MRNDTDTASVSAPVIHVLLTSSQTISPRLSSIASIEQVGREPEVRIHGDREVDVPVEAELLRHGRANVDDDAERRDRDVEDGPPRLSFQGDATEQ